MKAIVIKQPFAHFLAEGKKTLEIRTWQVKHRGPLLIIAGQKLHDGNCIYQGQEIESLDAVKLLWRGGYTLALGKAIAVVNLTAIRPMVPADAEAAMHPYVSDAFVWELTEVRRIKTFSITGQMGLMDVDDDLIQPAEEDEYDDEYDVWGDDFQCCDDCISYAACSDFGCAIKPAIKKLPSP